jgi:murein hydrolase activator
MFRKQLNLKFQHITVVLNNISCKTCKAPKGFIGLLFLLFSLCISAQNKRGELEVKRQQLLKQIETTTLQLNKAQQTRTAARDKLEAVQTQIETREALINNLHEEIDETDNIISRTEEVLDALNEDINRLRIEYATMVRRAYKMKVPDNAILFMLSSNNFTEAYYKWQYFKMYDKFRKRQAKLITETQKSLLAKNDYLIQQKFQKQTLIGTNEQQRIIWEQEKQNKDKLIDELKNEEKRLSGELKSQEKQNLKINSSIERLISAELDTKRKAAEERQRKTQAEADRLALERTKEKKTKSRTNVAPETAAEKPRTGNIITESSENLALSSDFRNNKGKLPPPATGTIVKNFGKQHISDRLTAINNGIDIQTSSNADVRAVFTGNVSIISSIPGMGYVVLIQHGNYYTVYSNLSTVVVKKGQSVGTRQTIGYAGVNPVSNDSEVHFELWLERTHLNPASWIAR